MMPLYLFLDQKYSNIIILPRLFFVSLVCRLKTGSNFPGLTMSRAFGDTACVWRLDLTEAVGLAH